MIRDVCPHGVSREVKVERQFIDGVHHERHTFLECLKCTEAMGVIVLMNMLSDPSPPQESAHARQS